MKIEYKEGLIVLKDQDEEVGYIKYVRKEENVIDVISTVVHEKYQGQVCKNMKMKLDQKRWLQHYMMPN